MSTKKEAVGRPAHRVKEKGVYSLKTFEERDGSWSCVISMSNPFIAALTRFEGVAYGATEALAVVSALQTAANQIAMVVNLSEGRRSTEAGANT